MLSPNTLVTPLVVDSLLDLISGCADDKQDWSIITSLMMDVENTKRMVAVQVASNPEVCNAILHLFFIPVASYLDAHCSLLAFISRTDATVDYPTLHALLVAYSKVFPANAPHD